MLGNLFGLFSGDPGILQTVGKIKDAVYYALREPEQKIRLRAENLVRPSQERDDKAEVRALLNFVQNSLHFVKDPYGLEFVKSPDVVDSEIKSYGQFIGDCDDASAYLAALLKSVGYPVSLTVLAPPGKEKFSHIYVQAYLPKEKRWIALDPTAKNKRFGWSAANARESSYAV